MIRAATFSDAPDIAQLHSDSWKKTYRGMMTDAFLDELVEQRQQQVWHDALRHPLPIDYTAVFEKNDKIVGFVHVKWQKDAIFGTHIDNLHVAEQYKGHGIGTILMRHIATELEHRFGERHFYLWVLEQNHPARFFYEKVGGQLIETTPNIMPDGQTHARCRYVWQHFGT